MLFLYFQILFEMVSLTTSKTYCIKILNYRSKYVKSVRRPKNLYAAECECLTYNMRKGCHKFVDTRHFAARRQKVTLKLESAKTQVFAENNGSISHHLR